MNDSSREVFPDRSFLLRWLIGAAVIIGTAFLFTGCDVFSSEEPNEPPTARILAPEDGSTYQEGEEIGFEGEVEDPDGSLVGGSIVWRSTVDGRIGAGPQTANSALSPGDHRVWLVVEDERGAADSASVGITVEDTPSASELPYAIRPAFPNLTFGRPTNMEPSPDGERFYLTEQKGVIRVFPDDPGASESEVFVDLTDRVLLQDEHTAEGLLGFALDPQFEQNGYFYVLYTAEGPYGRPTYTEGDTTTGIGSVLARFRAAGPTRADPGSEKVLLTIDQPYIYHNGGQLLFGPEDEYLYVAMGDGGKWGDPEDRAQDTSSLYGTILRIDPHGSAPGKAYGIPSDNPFATSGDSSRAEIWAYGLRNVWRMSFDEEGRLWAGDVGQGAYEEVNLVEKGKNYGWDHREGSHCYEPSSDCRSEGLTEPVWDYGRSEGYSVNGGYVYRGSRLPELRGTYVYGDHVNTRIWALTLSGKRAAGNRLIARAPNGSPLYRQGTEGGVSTFAEGRDGHLYVLGLNGKIYHLEAQEGS